MKVLFVGPSLHGQRPRLAERHPDLVLRPPAARGDIARAVGDGATAIGLVDGLFGASQSVWHKEILFALEKGIAVGGGASMGALRAAECDAFGMAGIGGIYDDYKAGRLTDDEEVSLAHGPVELDWLPLSVPWVNFAATVVEASAQQWITADERNLIIVAGREMHFTERTFRKALLLCQGLTVQRRSAILAYLASALRDRKREDAWKVVDWLVSPIVSAPVPPWTLSRTTHWRLLEHEVRLDQAVR